MNRRGLVLSVLAVGAAGFGGAAWYATRPQPMAEAVPVAPSERCADRSIPDPGPETAPVTIVEFFDPACEACRAFYPVVKDIMTEHGVQMSSLIYCLSRESFGGSDPCSRSCADAGCVRTRAGSGPATADRRPMALQHRV